MNINHLSISWSVSRGRDTYGYNICRLDSRNTGKRYKCSGGGYDMVGTVFGDWLAAEHQERLKQWANNQPSEDAGYAVKGYKKMPGFSGVTIDPDGTVSCDGACGIESMLRIAEACGLEVQREYQKTGRNRGRTLGWLVCAKGGVKHEQPPIHFSQTFQRQTPCLCS